MVTVYKVGLREDLEPCTAGVGLQVGLMCSLAGDPLSSLVTSEVELLMLEVGRSRGGGAAVRACAAGAVTNDHLQVCRYDGSEVISLVMALRLMDPELLSHQLERGGL